MPDVLGRYRVELVWIAVGVTNYAARMAWPSWETIPLHFVWIGLTLVCALRVWPVTPSRAVVVSILAVAGAALLADALGVQLWNRMLAIPPLIAVLYLTLLWQARRRVEAQHVAAGVAEERSATLERQHRFVHDASHELRTPVTIARGHLELLLRNGGGKREVEIALDELARVDAAIGRLLLLAQAEQADFLVKAELELGPFLEELLLRWSGTAARAWRLGPVVAGSLRVDCERLRAALDALLENAVKYSPPGALIELRARGDGKRGVLIEVEDEGFGVPAPALGRIFGRFARADMAHTGSAGGVGLGLAIADAIAKRHGGMCTVAGTSGGSIFALALPEFTPAPGAQARLLPALS